MKDDNGKIVKDLLYRMADDLLVLGHRNSEWTGLGPILEEDIAFSSMAQDKLGHAQALYTILHELGEPEPDANAFSRNANDFRNCQFTELPNGEYDFSLMRHFLFDHADQLRFAMLASSAFEPLAKVARKVRGELKYHVYHADTWLRQLSNGNEESRARMQTALNEAWNYALGIFEEGGFEAELAAKNIFEGERELQVRWLNAIVPLMGEAGLKLPPQDEWKPQYGGRKGYHTLHLQPLVEEMGEVFRVDPSAEW
jgi:ring-1,2-phenylacetyl-CoA epoxidase subunit PaaC